MRQTAVLVAMNMELAGLGPSGARLLRGAVLLAPEMGVASSQGSERFSRLVSLVYRLFSVFQVRFDTIYFGILGGGMGVLYLLEHELPKPNASHFGAPAFCLWR